MVQGDLDEATHAFQEALVVSALNDSAEPVQVNDVVLHAPPFPDAESDGDAVILTPIPPEGRGLPAVENWAQLARPVRLLAAPAGRAVALFAKGELA